MSRRCRIRHGAPQSASRTKNRNMRCYYRHVCCLKKCALAKNAAVMQHVEILSQREWLASVRSARSVPCSVRVASTRMLPRQVVASSDMLPMTRPRTHCSPWTGICHTVLFETARAGTSRLGPDPSRPTRPARTGACSAGIFIQRATDYMSRSPRTAETGPYYETVYQYLAAAGSYIRAMGHTA
jgi:hypothetical protein